MKEIVSLNGAWTLTEALGVHNIPAQVPGSVLGDLLANELIPDPFFRENEYSALRLFDRDYTYYKEFDVPETLFAKETIELVFLGLDTLAEVTLNGHCVLSVDNMHRTWRVPVKQYLCQTGNHINVVFRSPNQYIAVASRNNPDVTYDGTGYTMGSNFLRKAHCMFGWDWGPQLPDAGIWRPCQLEGYDKARIDHVEILQYHQENRVRLCVSAQGVGECFSSIQVTLLAPNGAQQAVTNQGNTLELVVEDPQLWQPNGWGAQPLYTVIISVFDSQGIIIDETTRRIGLRTITLSRAKDEWGEEFCFVVNGRKLFSMGADYIPEDNLIGRTSPQRTNKLLTDCVKANFNTVRVWGGGYYPEDWFFDQCDELGLIVWLDLMYACNVYKLTDVFEKNIVAETRDNLLRVRHHACIGLICGNNEMESGWVDWPAVRNHSMALRADYIKQFEYVLQKESAEYAPQSEYWPSSPSSGGSFDDPNSYDRGDVHCWDVWHGLLPFEAYRQKYPRFCSEFGFESFPCMQTVQSYTLPADRNIYSRVMESHQKCVGGNGKIMYYISQNFKYPSTLAHVLYASQLQQAEAMRAGVEHWRRYRGRCMGAIYWQLNDCWPVASWASIDSLGRWKQLHYAAKRFFAPVLISCERKGYTIRVNVVNDALEPFDGQAEICLVDPLGTIIRKETCAVHAEPLHSVWVYAGDLTPTEASLHPEDEMALVLRLTNTDGVVISENCELFTAPKCFAFVAPNINWSITQTQADCNITLTCKAFAWGVWLETLDRDVRFSDNGLFLMPNELKSIVAYNTDADGLRKQLSVVSIADLDQARDA